jgi:hypothetical protein
MKSGARLLRWAILFTGLVSIASLARAEEPPEYRLKAAFLYNFALFTEWPATIGNTLNLCIRGNNPFGDEIDGLEGKAVNARMIAVQRKGGSESLKGCQIVFIAASAMGALPQVLDELRNSPVLTVADSPGAARQGVALNMMVKQNKITFEANLQAAQAARVTLSSKLLRLATEVYQ